MNNDKLSEKPFFFTIRKAKEEDIEYIYELTLPFVQKEILLPRSKKQIKTDIDFTWVAIKEKSIIGTSTLIRFSETLYEVRALVVDLNHQKYNIGKSLIETLEVYLRENCESFPLRLFALTYVPNFFIRLGYQITNKENFPEKIYNVCRFCPHQTDCKEIAVEKYISPL